MSVTMANSQAACIPPYASREQLAKAVGMGAITPEQARQAAYDMERCERKNKSVQQPQCPQFDMASINKWTAQGMITPQQYLWYQMKNACGDPGVFPQSPR